MVDKTLALVEGREFVRVSVGVPAQAVGWIGLDFQAAFGVPTKVVNDAAMQAIGTVPDAARRGSLGGPQVVILSRTGRGAAWLAR
jgi:polyphosphate glucokinase